jgi:hypothetical protein
MWKNYTNVPKPGHTTPLSSADLHTDQEGMPNHEEELVEWGDEIPPGIGAVTGSISGDENMEDEGMEDSRTDATATPGLTNTTPSASATTVGTPTAASSFPLPPVRTSHTNNRDEKRASKSIFKEMMMKVRVAKEEVTARSCCRWCGDYHRERQSVISKAGSARTAER